MCECDSKSKKQEAFWLALLDKYEQRNLEYQQQQCSLRHHLEAMECAMPAALMNRMDKTGDGQVNMVQFMSQIGNPGTTVTNTASIISDCPCSTCTETRPRQQSRSLNADSCTCDPCTALTSTENKPECTCASTPPSASSSTCECNAGSVQNSDMMDQLSLFSIHSSDLLFMNKLQELSSKEKEMKRQIMEMEIKEQSLMDTLRKADEMWASVEGNYKKQLSDEQQNGDCMRIKYEKMNEQLIEENARLIDELKDVKLELKQCMERLEGPICRQLDKERRKNQQLESELGYAKQNMADKESCYKNELDDMQGKIDCSCGKLCELTCTNEQLKNDICALECKYNVLQQELINQKLSEAQTLQRLNASLAMNEDECDCQNETPVQSCCDHCCDH